MKILRFWWNICKKQVKEPEHVIDCFTALIVPLCAINKEYIETIHSLQIDQLEASKQKLHLSHRVVIQTSSLFCYFTNWVWNEKDYKRSRVSSIGRLPIW